MVQQTSAAYKFQFHKGTIRTERLDIFLVLEVKFQFHKGTIRTLDATQDQVEDGDFNSIKVRLELSVSFTENGYRVISIP